MEAELIIKLPDGTTKTIPLKDVTFNTTYMAGGTTEQPALVGRIALYGELADAAPDPSVT